MKAWIVGAIVAVVALIVGAGAGAYAIGKQFADAEPVVVDTRTDVVHSVVREQQVVLLSLGVQGIQETRSGAKKILGIDVPGSDRAMFIQYNFNAKLGIEGGEVKIKELGEKGYLLTIPDFIFIGHDDVTFKMAAEQNGVLSWVTPEIDTVKTVNNVLNDGGKQKHISDNAAILRDQAKFFYSNIIRSIEPDAEIEFVFGSGN